MSDELKIAIIWIIIAAIVFGLIVGLTKTHNSETHSDDIKITEWISPDGVHYWYRQDGYRAMLAPRYTASGNLVVDEVK